MLVCTMGSPAPKADKNLQRQRAAEEADAKAQADLLAQQQADDEAKRRAGLVGRRQLLSGTDLGFPLALGASQQ